MASMTLIGKLYNTFSYIVTMVLISFWYTKNNIAFKGINRDLDEEQVPENGIFWRISFVV